MEEVAVMPEVFEAISDLPEVPTPLRRETPYFLYRRACPYWGYFPTSTSYPIVPHTTHDSGGRHIDFSACATSG